MKIYYLSLNKWPQFEKIFNFVLIFNQNSDKDLSYEISSKSDRLTLICNITFYFFSIFSQLATNIQKMTFHT